MANAKDIMALLSQMGVTGQAGPSVSYDGAALQEAALASAEQPSAEQGSAEQGGEVFVVPDDEMQQYGAQTVAANSNQNTYDLLDMINKDKMANPIWRPPVGTQTASAKLNNENLELNKTQQAWNQKMDAANYNLAVTKANTPKETELTEAEKKKMANDSMLQEALTNYDKLRNTKSKKTGKDYTSPLYYTISGLLADDALISKATQTGADRESIINNVLATQKLSPDQYFNTPKGAKLKALYETLIGKKLATPAAKEHTTMGGR